MKPLNPFRPGKHCRISTIKAGGALAWFYHSSRESVYVYSRAYRFFLQLSSSGPIKCIKINTWECRHVPCDICFDISSNKHGFNADDLGMFEDDIIANEFDLADPIDRDLWVRHMFEDEDSDDDNEEFEGFESHWKTENYHHNRRSAFNRKPGVKPLQYLIRFLLRSFGRILVTETNNYSDQTRQTSS